MEKKDPRLLQIWGQKKPPVFYRQGRGKPLLVRLPYAATNRQWLKGDHRNQPEWVSDQKCWQVPKAWFEDIVKQA